MKQFTLIHLFHINLHLVLLIYAIITMNMLLVRKITKPFTKVNEVLVLANISPNEVIANSNGILIPMLTSYFDRTYFLYLHPNQDISYYSRCLPEVFFLIRVMHLQTVSSKTSHFRFFPAPSTNNRYKKRKIACDCVEFLQA